jgi:uncharacterized protein (TIGR02172 family)
MSEYRVIDMSTWTQVGQGGNGTTYENPSQPDLILKVDKKQINTLEFVKHEFDVSKAVENLGLPTPKMHEMVRVGDLYGTISDRIKDKKSLSRICHDEPQRIEEMAQLMCRNGKILFNTPCNTDFFPSRKEQLMRALDKAQFISRKNRRILKDFAQTVQDIKTCSHGDFNMGNLVLSGDQPVWIDLDRFGYGDPMFDIGHLYQICNVYAPMKQVQDIFHMTEQQLNLFWDAFAKAYTGQDDHSEFDSQAGRFACFDMILRYEFQKCSLLEKMFFGVYIKRLIKAFYL